MKVFRGEKTADGCIVEIDNEGDVTPLSLEKSLQVVNHSPDVFQYEYNGSGPVQLAAAILYETTGDPELTQQYYQFFHRDYVAMCGDTFETTEHEVSEWLRSVGAFQTDIKNEARSGFEVLNQLYEQINRRSRRVSRAGQCSSEAILACEEAISLTFDWVQRYKSHIQVSRSPIPEILGWRPMLEEIRNQLGCFKNLLPPQQADRSKIEMADQTREEVVELLEVYLPDQSVW